MKEKEFVKDVKLWVLAIIFTPLLAINGWLAKQQVNRLDKVVESVNDLSKNVIKIQTQGEYFELRLKALENKTALIESYLNKHINETTSYRR